MKNTIREGHRVRSADGTEYDVSYVNERTGEAGLRDVNNFDSYIELPLGELKRVTKSKRIPIEGMPETRPRCPYCNRPLRPRVNHERARRDPSNPKSAFGDVVRRVFTEWSGYTIERGNAFDKFCTLGCARGFANAAFRAGYRIKRKE